MLDEELKGLDKPEIKVEIVESFAYHSDLTNAFKDKSCVALKEMVQYYVGQQNIGEKKRNKEKLDILSHLVLSRIQPTIHEFAVNEETKFHGTDFNWSVILGSIQPVASTMGTVYSSHPTNMHSLRCDVMFYQKIECFFALNGKPKKVECIVFCQKFKDMPVSLNQFFNHFREMDWLSIDTLTYLFVFVLTFFFFITNRICSSG